MKVIDIYNKIANGEEVPKFRLNDGRYEYYMKDGFLYQNKLDYREEEVEWYVYKDWLNREIEIIDDNFKDIEELEFHEDNLRSVTVPTNAHNYALGDFVISTYKTLNDLIKNQKKIIEKLKEE